MAWFLDHLEWHMAGIAFAWLLYLIWPWIRRSSWPRTPEFNVRYGWAILALALIAALAWVFLFWQAMRAGWL
jgi:hypothetical protein